MYKLLHLFLTILLVCIAVLQLNDPDPLFWTSLYLVSAVVPLFQLVSIRPCYKIYAFGLASGFCIAGIALVLSGASDYLQHVADESLIQDMSPEKPYIEEARELIGTFIALFIVLAYAYFSKRSSRQD